MIRLKLHEIRDDSIEKSATNATAPRPVVGTSASRQTMRYTGGAVATEYPVMMIRVICIVKLTRSQKPAPNHAADWTGELPAATLARKTRTTATSASANASGNQCSNQSDRRRPADASHEPPDRSESVIRMRMISNGSDRYNPVDDAR